MLREEKKISIVAICFDCSIVVDVVCFVGSCYIHGMPTSSELVSILGNKGTFIVHPTVSPATLISTFCWKLKSVE